MITIISWDSELHENAPTEGYSFPCLGRTQKLPKLEENNNTDFCFNMILGLFLKDKTVVLNLNDIQMLIRISEVLNSILRFLSDFKHLKNWYVMQI